MNITYTRNGDYLIPNIIIRKTKPIGHYGRLRKAYLEMCSGKYPAILSISMIELSILETVERYPNCMMKKVSELLGLPKSTLTSVVKRLEAKGYLRRSQNDSDKRAYNLELTEWGAQAQIEHREIENSIFENLLQQLDTEETSMFLELFTKAVN